MKLQSIILFIGLFYSCISLPPEVKEVLEEAGNNRKELEQVLNYYCYKDRQKYEAACYLITQMRFHSNESQTSLSPFYQKFFHSTDSLFHTLFGNLKPADFPTKTKEYDNLRRSLAEQYTTFPTPVVLPPSGTDLQNISAEFLIDNIEQAFDVWHKSPFCRNMDFETFKESILPYRTSTEEITFKRSELRNMFEKIINLSDTLTDITLPIERYKAYISQCRWLNYYIKTKDHTGIFDLFLPRFKMDCYHLTNWTCNIFRACGIPVYHEYTPQWKERDRGHFWCCSPDKKGILQPYTAPDNNLREDWESDIQYAGKVYRRTFGVQMETPYFLCSPTEYVPENLHSALLSDQTFRYHTTVTLCLPFNLETNNRLAYLCFFRQGEYYPVAWGKTDHQNNEVVFTQVPLNTLFFPVYYKNGEPPAFCLSFYPAGFYCRCPCTLVLQFSESDL